MLASLMRLLPGLMIVLLNVGILHAAQTAELILSGQVIDQFGAPVHGVRMTFHDQATRTIIVQTTSDVAGGYRLDLAPVALATAVPEITWAQLKLRPSLKAVTATSTRVPRLFGVIATHAEITDFHADSLTMPETHVMDFVVQRLNATDGATGSRDVTDTGGGNSADTTAAGDSATGDPATVDSVHTSDPDPVQPEPDLQLERLAVVALNGTYIDSIAVAAPRSQYSVGDTVRLHFIAIGLREVRQFDLRLRLPVSSVLLEQAKFFAQSPFSSPGGTVEKLDSFTLRVGGASLSTSVTRQSFDLGEVVLPTIGPVPAGDLRLRSVSVGRRSSERDALEDLLLPIPLVIE